MAYFPNGTAGMILDSQCGECIHEDPDAGCPIAMVQMEYNYEQIGNDNLEKCMNALVSEEGVCLMKLAIEKYYTKKPLENVEVSTYGTKYIAPEWKPKGNNEKYDSK